MSCASLAHVKGEELGVGISTASGEEAKGSQHDVG